MVHDEEAEISIRLDTLIANSQRSRSAIGHLGSPETLPNAAGDAAEGLHDSHQAADAGMLLLFLLSLPRSSCCSKYSVWPCSIHIHLCQCLMSRVRHSSISQACFLGLGFACYVIYCLLLVQ